MMKILPIYVSQSWRTRLPTEPGKSTIYDAAFILRCFHADQSWWEWQLLNYFLSLIRFEEDKPHGTVGCFDIGHLGFCKDLDHKNCVRSGASEKR